MARWRSMLPIALILVLAAALRFWGLRWGLPNEDHSYSYHPDEFLTVGAAASILAGGLPGFYNYPSLYLYLAALSILSASVYGLGQDMGSVYLAARVITALMGVAAVAATYWAAKKWADTTWDRPGHVAPDSRGIALVAALIVCIAPLHVQHSHFATVDVPSTLFVGLCLGFAFLVLSRGSWRDYLLCGAMAGLAAGTKYNAGLVVLSLLAAHFLGSKDRNAGVRRLLVALGAFVTAFVISTPGSIMETRSFIHGLTYEMRHAAEGHGLVFAGTGNGFIFTFMSSLWYGLGPALAILFVASVLYGLIRLDHRALVVLAFTIPYYALISLSQVRFARYALPMYPAAALLIAWMAIDLWRRIPKVIRWTWAAILTLTLAGTFLYTIALDRLFIQKPPQDRALGVIYKSIPPRRDSIGVVDVPWFYSPPYSRTAGLGTLSQREQAMVASRHRLDLLRGEHQMTEALPRWAVLADYEVSDVERLRGSRSVTKADRERIASTIELLETIKDYYVLRESFRNSLSLLGIPFGSTQALPHDMRYAAPTIWIYERKK